MRPAPIRKMREMPDTSAEQPDSFVGWWEAVFFVRDGEQQDVTGMIEHVDAAGNFTVFRDGERIGAGRHVKFTVDPDGFTNVPEVAWANAPNGRELAVYRFSGDVFEARPRILNPAAGVNRTARSTAGGWLLGRCRLSAVPSVVGNCSCTT